MPLYDEPITLSDLEQLADRLDLANQEHEMSKWEQEILKTLGIPADLLRKDPGAFATRVMEWIDEQSRTARNGPAPRL